MRRRRRRRKGRTEKKHRQKKAETMMRSMQGQLDCGKEREDEEILEKEWRAKTEPNSKMRMR